MDTRPIGVFDSGLGGLTTVKKLTELLPNENIIYLGDTGRVPYGSRSRETIIKYSQQDAEFLSQFDIKAMVIACNTACSSAYEVLDQTYDFPVYEVVTAPATTAAAVTKNGRIGVIGTLATTRSGAYESAIRRIDAGLNVFPVPCPLFVALVENGRCSPDDIAALTIAEDYLKALRDVGVDTLILGCTHYPLLSGVIAKVMGPDVTLIDSGAETARVVASDLSSQDMLAPPSIGGDVRYFVTDCADGFATLASVFLESDVFGAVKQITLDTGDN